MTNYTVNKQDELYNVVDEMEFVINTFETAKDAKAFIKDLEAMDNRLQHIEADDEVEAVEDEEVVVETAVEVEAVIETAVEEVVVDAVVAEEVEAVIETDVVEVKGEKKSDKVRARIAIAKQKKEGKEVVVAWAIAELGMKKALAKAYVDGNWRK